MSAHPGARVGFRRGAARLPKPLRIGALGCLVALTVLTVAVLGRTETWHSIESRWRLRVGAPEQTTAYPSDIGDPVERIAVVGDVGTGGGPEYRTGRALDALETTGEFDALLFLGDNVYPDGDPRHVRANVLDPFAGVLDGPTDLVAALGNHDVGTGDGVPIMKALEMPGRWYQRRLGPVRLLVVDSTRASDPDQLAWLDRTLAEPTDARWTIVMQHHPPFSAGYHGSDAASRKYLVPRYVAAGVDLVLAGHDHDYQRTKPQDGVTYVVSGGAAKLRPTGRADFTAESASTYHFVELAVYADRIDVHAVQQDGRVFDSFSLTPRP